MGYTFFESFYGSTPPVDLSSRWNVRTRPTPHVNYGDLVLANVLDPDKFAVVTSDPDTGPTDRASSVFDPGDVEVGTNVAVQLRDDLSPGVQVAIGVYLTDGNGSFFEAEFMPEAVEGETWNLWANCSVGTIEDLNFSGQGILPSNLGGGSVTSNTIDRLRAGDWIRLEVHSDEEGEFAGMPVLRIYVKRRSTMCEVGWEEVWRVVDFEAAAEEAFGGPDYNAQVLDLLALGSWFGGIKILELYEPDFPSHGSPCVGFWPPCSNRGYFNYQARLDNFMLSDVPFYNPIEPARPGLCAKVQTYIQGNLGSWGYIRLGWNPATGEWEEVPGGNQPPTDGSGWPGDTGLPYDPTDPSGGNPTPGSVAQPIDVGDDPETGEPIIVVVVPPDDFVLDPDSPTGWTPTDEYVPPDPAPESPVTPSTNATLHEYAEDVLDVVAAALATTAGGAIDRAYVSPGLPAVDCEQVTVTAVGLSKDATAPGNPPPATGHRHRLGSINLASFAVTIVRDCIPVAGPRGAPPSTDALDDSALVVNEDVWAVWNALEHAKAAGELLGGACRELYLDNAAPLATSGQMAGWLISFRAAVDGTRPGT